MGIIKGSKQYEKFIGGAKLTRKEAMLAMCYDCNGGDESSEDCGGTLCPLYDYRPYKGR